MHIFICVCVYICICNICICVCIHINIFYYILIARLEKNIPTTLLWRYTPYKVDMVNILVMAFKKMDCMYVYQEHKLNVRNTSATYTKYKLQLKQALIIHKIHFCFSPKKLLNRFTSITCNSTIARNFFYQSTVTQRQCGEQISREPMSSKSLEPMLLISPLDEN